MSSRMKIYLICLPNEDDQHQWLSYGDTSFVPGNIFEAVVFTDLETAKDIAHKYDGEIIPFVQGSFDDKIIPFKLKEV